MIVDIVDNDGIEEELQEDVLDGEDETIGDEGDEGGEGDNPDANDESSEGQDDAFVDEASSVVFTSTVDGEEVEEEVSLDDLESIYHEYKDLKKSQEELNLRKREYETASEVVRTINGDELLHFAYANRARGYTAEQIVEHAYNEFVKAGRIKTTEENLDSMTESERELYLTKKKLEELERGVHTSQRSQVEERTYNDNLLRLNEAISEAGVKAMTANEQAAINQAVSQLYPNINWRQASMTPEQARAIVRLANLGNQNTADKMKAKKSAKIVKSKQVAAASKAPKAMPGKPSGVKKEPAGTSPKPAQKPYTTKNERAKNLNNLLNF